MGEQNAENRAPGEGQAVSVMRCLWGPSRCMDDLCRNSHVGLCGLTDEDFTEPEYMDDADDWGDDD